MVIKFFSLFLIAIQIIYYLTYYDCNRFLMVGNALSLFFFCAIYFIYFIISFLTTIYCIRLKRASKNRILLVITVFTTILFYICYSYFISNKITYALPILVPELICIFFLSVICLIKNK